MNDQDKTLRQLMSEYFDECRERAREVVKEHPGDGEAQIDALAEAIEWSARIIYTYQARLVLVLTDNPTAWADEGVDRPNTVEGEAFWAMYSDARDYLETAREEAEEATEQA